jgi:hypothetical protein
MNNPMNNPMNNAVTPTPVTQALYDTTKYDIYKRVPDDRMNPETIPPQIPPTFQLLKDTFGNNYRDENNKLVILKPK